MGRLTGKVAVITGAGSGIGEAGAHLFAREGARVVVADLHADRVEATVTAIREAGGTATGSVTDVADRASVEAMVDAAISDQGTIDILWNNAGIGTGAGTPIEQIAVEDWLRVVDVNLNGVFYAIRAVLPHMKARRSGSILTTSSICGMVAFVPGGAAYAATKGAVIAITRVLALELAGFNIRVNCIAPGRVRTRIGEGATHPDGNPFAIDWPLPIPHPQTDATREAEPIEIAHTALHLVSDEVGPLTGTTITHDGGITSF